MTARKIKVNDMIKNAKLQNMFHLSSKVTVYVPATTGISTEIDNTEYVNSVATLLSNCFGGSTSSQALGYWVSPTAGLVKEHTTMVFAYASDGSIQDHIEEVISMCEDLKEKLTQDAIALEINGEMYFI